MLTAWNWASTSDGHQCIRIGTPNVLNLNTTYLQVESLLSDASMDCLALQACQLGAATAARMRKWLRRRGFEGGDRGQ